MSCTVFFEQNIPERITSDIPEESMKLQILHSVSFLLALPYFISMITKAFLRSHQALLSPAHRAAQGRGKKISPHVYLIFSYNKSRIQHTVPCLHHLHPAANTAPVQDLNVFHPMDRSSPYPIFLCKLLGRKLKFWTTSQIQSLTFGIKEDKVFMPTNGCYLGIWVGSTAVTACYVTKLNLEVFYPNSQSTAGSLLFLMGLPEPTSTTIIRLLWGSSFFKHTTKTYVGSNATSIPLAGQSRVDYPAASLDPAARFYQGLLWKENTLNQK